MRMLWMQIRVDADLYLHHHVVLRVEIFIRISSQITLLLRQDDRYILPPCTTHSFRSNVRAACN